MYFPSTNSITNILDKASSATKTGIVAGAKVLAKGIEKTGDLIQSRTSEGEEKEIKILPKVQSASKATNLIVGTSHKLIGKAVNRTLETAENVWYSMPESELMKKICENEKFKIGMEVGKAGASAGMNIIGGVGEGLSLVKESTLKSTVKVVEHKYGSDAGKAAKEGFNIAGNIFGVYQMTYAFGLVGISATEVMKIKEDDEMKTKIILDTLTHISI